MKLTPQQKALLSTLQYQFTDDTLFVRALTHSSLGKSSTSNNQRLEFLGDRVLGLIIAERLLEENIEASEGYIHPQFSALVKKETCADIATKIDLGESLLMSRSESLCGGRKRTSILGDAMEAIIGAIYLDGGLNQVRRIIHSLWSDAFSDVGEASYDPKSALNEWSQSSDQELPVYIVKSRKGPVHAPEFCIEVSLKNGLSATGVASSKRGAEQIAASELLKILKKKENTFSKKAKPWSKDKLR